VSFQPRDFYDVGLFLLADVYGVEREALDGTAVGRFYYAAFLAIRRHLRAQGVRTSTFGSVILALDAVPALVGLSADLDELHALRNRADYDDTNEFSRARFDHALRLVDRIHGRLALGW